MKMCKECGIKEVIGYKLARCPECHRAWKAKIHRDYLATKRRAMFKRNSELIKFGNKICSLCFHERRLSEYSVSLPDGKRGTGKVNGICDRCLTRAYARASRLAADTIGETNFWRKKAYSCNTVERNRIYRETHVRIKVCDLSWVCKPQYVAGLYESQNGLCVYCRAELAASMHIDHITPLGAGGAHALHNIQLLCADCNRLKHLRTDDEFKEFIVGYHNRLSSLVVELRDKEPAG